MRRENERSEGNGEGKRRKRKEKWSDQEVRERGEEKGRG